MEKKKLLVSFSGGETSAYMAKWLLDNKQDEFEMLFVFANTGQENEQTLEFVKKCETFFKIPIVWVEAKVFHGERKGTGFNIVNFDTASRDGKPFEEVIKKYSIPNIKNPHCTRELKQNPIKEYAKSIGWKNYHLAIGIRADEITRVNGNYENLRILYPLANFPKGSGKRTSKPQINEWWDLQPFRLELKGYQGNCVSCWKKSDNKLFQIATENPNAFCFFDKMEQKYGNYIPESRLKLMRERGEAPVLPNTFFRGNRTAKDILEQSKYGFKIPKDDSLVDEKGIQLSIDLLDGESCDVWSECGAGN